MIEYSTGRVEFERHTNKTLTSEFDGKWLYVKRLGVARRSFVGIIDGAVVVQGKTEKETVYNLVEYVSGW